MEFSGVAAFAPHDQLEIYGDHGSLTYDFRSDLITEGRTGDTAPQPIPIPPDLVRPWTVEQDFISAVKHPSNPRPHPTFKDGVAYMRVVQAVADSIATTRRVEIMKDEE